MNCYVITGFTNTSFEKAAKLNELICPNFSLKFGIDLSIDGNANGVEVQKVGNWTSNMYVMPLTC